jgi:hypothetical protein
MDATIPNYTYGLVIPPLYPKIISLAHITTPGTYLLWGTSLTHVTLSQQPMEKAYALSSLTTHMYTPRTLLGRLYLFHIVKWLAMLLPRAL